MFIRRVQLQNIGGLGTDERPIDLDLSHSDGRFAGWTVIAGPNGSGKTTLLRAMALAAAGPEVSRLLQDSASGWIRDGADSGSVSLELDRGPRDAFYLPSLGPEGGFDTIGGREPYGVQLTWRRSAHAQEPQLVAVRTEQRSHDPGYGIWIPYDQTPGWFIAGYGAYRRLARGSVDAQRLSDSTRRPVAQLASLFREDAVFSETVQWLERGHLLRLEGKNGSGALLSKIFKLLNDGLLPGNTRLLDVDSDGIWAEQNGVRLPLRRLSDGYQTMTGMVLDLLRQLQGAYDQLRLVELNGRWIVENEGVVLIDELELHLHPAWQQKAGFWFKEHFPNIQFIVTTHSPFVCQAADPGGLIRLPGPLERRGSLKLEGDAYFAVVNGTVDDAVMSELFGLEHVRSPRAEALVDTLAALEARILAGGASSSEVERYEHLKRQLPPSAEVVQALRRLES